MGKRKQFRVVAVFDTETCNIGTGSDTRAYPILYIFNDLRHVQLRAYVPGAKDVISFYRHETEAIAFIDSLVADGQERGFIPVVCAYNLMFDLQTLLQRLANAYEMQAIAQSNTNAYAVDLCVDGAVVLRFWDTFHLEMNGLAAMGRCAGLPKAVGDWNYSLVRTPETPLTDAELGYAARDVQVIPAYLRYLLDAYDWLNPSQFGHTVLTKTSLVRQMAQVEVGRLHVDKYTLFSLFQMRCMEELPGDYDTYALRRACFRGGFTFTGAMAAGITLRNVHAIDVVSMHHAYICGRRVPVKFERCDAVVIQQAAEYICTRTIEDVLRRYDCPFAKCMHARIEFDNIRLREGSAFETYQIGLLAESKFTISQGQTEFDLDERNKAAEDAVRAVGWRDTCIGATFAFGKLYSAKVAVVHVTELELWNMSRVYEWDAMRVMCGELSIKTIIPPDYVTLQSNMLFERKSDAKDINNLYKEGEPYKHEIPDSIPDGIAQGLKSGEISNAFFSSWYQSSVKGAFNGVYGTMAMDVFRPEFIFDDNGDMGINRATLTTPMNFDEKKPKRCKVFYNYGMRIVGGSRMHLIIALELIHARYPEALVTGGDTDSLKVCTPENISAQDILACLEPLERAVTDAIHLVMTRVRRLYPDKASTLDRIGCFDDEGTAEYHYEAWNKARVSIVDGKPHITCAGLSRPDGAYHIEHWIAEMLEEHAPEVVFPLVLGYNGLVAHEVCHALGHYRPEPFYIYKGNVTDYLGATHYVEAHEAVALYPASRELGSVLKNVNLQSLNYLKRLGRKPEERERVITRDEAGHALLWIQTMNDLEQWHG